MSAASPLPHLYAAPAHPIRLRALRETDLPAIYRWHQDEDTVQSLGTAFRFRNEAEALAHMKDWLRSSESHVRLAIERSADARLVGMTSLLGIDQIHRRASLHLMLGEREARGKGYGSLATALLLKHGFADLGLQRIGLEVLADNRAARAIYEKAGFSVEGELRSALFKAGARHNVVLMSILAAEYFAAHS